MFRFQNAQGSTTDDKSATTTADFYRDAVLFGNSFKALWPGALKFDEHGHKFFLNMTGGHVEHYAYIARDGSDGEVFAGTGVAPDGSVIIGVVYGPLDDFTKGKRGGKVFDSIIREGG
jgi:hypothetical protein